MPDEAHEKYHKENPKGNHVIPSPETTRFMDKTNTRYNHLNDTLLGLKDTLLEFKIRTEEGIKVMHEKQDHTNGWINDHEKEWRETKETYGTMWKDQRRERLDSKKRVLDLGWKLFIVVGISVLSILNIKDLF